MGNVKINVEPLPGVLSTQMFPACARTMLAEIARPSPVPMRRMLGIPRQADVLHPVELVEDRASLIGGDANAMINDTHLKSVSDHRACAPGSR